MAGQLRICAKCDQLTYVLVMEKGAPNALCTSCKTDALHAIPGYATRFVSIASSSQPVKGIPKASGELEAIDRDLSGSIYVYLAEEKHVSNWVNGGVIPIGLASGYKATEFKGNKTPDENGIHESPVDLDALREVGGIVLGGHIEDVTIRGHIGPGGQINSMHIPAARYGTEDGRVMCFSRTNSREIAMKLGDRKFCVRIDDIPRLKAILDECVGSPSEAGKCQYRDDFQRNPFVKRNDQAVLDEFRIYWKNLLEERSFSLPPGIGVEVEIVDSKTP